MTQLSWVLVWLVCLGAAVQPARAQSIDRVRDWNREVEVQVGQAAPSKPRLDSILKHRAAELEILAASDPRQAISLFLPENVIDRLRTITRQAPLESRGEWQGNVEKLIADDFEHHSSRTLWRLRLDDGSHLDLSFLDSRPRAGAAARLRGIRIGNRLVVSEVLRPDSISGPVCLTTGDQKIAVLMVTTPSYRSFPSGYTASSVSEAFFGSAADTNNWKSLNGFWRETSYGQASASGQVFGPFALNQDYSCSSSNDQNDALMAAAINAADGIVDFRQYTRVAIVFANTSCGYGGLSSVGCSTITSPTKGSLVASKTWLPVSNFSIPPVTVIAHELGHALGLDHGSTEDYSNVPLGQMNAAGATNEYGDAFSVMGATYGCPSNGVYAGGQYSAGHKSKTLHWLPFNSGYQEVQSSGTFALAPYESATGLRALRILRDATSNAWLWVEYRQQRGDIDFSLHCLTTNIFNGALVHYEDPALDPLHSYLLDFNPVSAPNNFVGTPALTPGQSWSDPYSLLSLRINSADSGGLSLAAQYDAPCATLSAPTSSFAAAGGSGAITVTAPAGCAWTANTASGWITLSGATSGNGNGTVSFQVAANATSAQRRDIITVQRQSVAISQGSSTGLQITSVSPSLGSGTTATFTMLLTASGGYRTIRDAYLAFTDVDSAIGSNVPECVIFVSMQGTPVAYLQPEFESGSTAGPLSFTGVNTISNSECSVSSTGSSVTGSGTESTIKLNVSFASTWAGTHNVLASMDANGGSTGTVRFGAWNVSTVASVTPTTTSLGSALNPSGYGQNVTLTASVSPPSATGTITFQDGNTSLGTVSLAGGSASVSTTTLSVGSHSITATYSGDPLYSGSATSLTQNVTAVITSTALSSSVNPSSAGQTVAFTAALSPSAATGTVIFKDGPTTIGSGNLSNGSASFATSTLSSGTHLITANYSGDSTYSPSSSSAFPQTVGTAATGVTLGSSLNPSVSGQNVMFTATLNPSNATGTVTFRDGASALSVVNITGGAATLVTAALAIGTHSITAVYNGDANYGGSTSAALTQTVSPVPTWSISGQVTLSGTGLSGVLVTLNNGATANTDTAGNYAFSGLNSGGTYSVTPSLNGYTFSPASLTFAAISANQTANFTATAVSGPVSISGTVTAGAGLGGVTVALNGSQALTTTTDTAGNYSFSVTRGGTYIVSAARVGYSFSGPLTFSKVASNQSANFTAVPISGLQFFPVTPCRVADTRAGGGKSGAFGPPTMSAGQRRTFPIPSGSCGIPSSAAAYSLNFTVLPKGYLGFLSTWPTGQAEPNVSTLNSYDGNVRSNAAIVPAGSGGSIDVHVTDATDVIFDINGYFAAAQSTGTYFFPVAPCRVADTRSGGGKTGAFGPPALGVNGQRTFPIPSSSCGLPANATAYSFNFTAIPQGYLGYLTTWPAGQVEPVVSTLNSYDGSVRANAAIVPAGASGAINVHVTDTADVLFDVNGYFGPQSGSGLQFYPVSPCRVADTRAAGGKTGQLGPPVMAAGQQRTLPISTGTCGIPPNASAYSLNITVIPQGYLGFLTTWPAGQSEPVASTLNSYNGQVVANAAIVPAGASGAINVHVTDVCDVLLDINGYFAP